MKNYVFLKSFGFSFAMSLIGSLVGVVSAALIVGHSAVKLAYNGAPHQNFQYNTRAPKSVKIRLLLIFVVMELSFLVSSFFPIIIYDWNFKLIPVLALSLGVVFFLAGFLIERYQKAIKVCSRLKKERTRENILKFAVL